MPELLSLFVHVSVSTMDCSNFKFVLHTFTVDLTWILTFL